MEKNKTQKMHAMAIDQFGGIGELNMKEFPIPELHPNQLLIKIEYAGVGRWDAAEREGLFAKMSEQEPEFPEVLGAEGVGRVAATGNDVRMFSIDDQVYGVALQRDHANGFYAEYIAVNEDDVFKVPKNLTMAQAAVLPIDGGTALRGLRDILKLSRGESVMIFGASGGMGHLAVQLAKRIGARVLAVASGEDGVDLCTRLGADAVVDGHEGDIIEVAKEFAPAGIDAALITTGSERVEKALYALRDNGRAAYPIQPEPKSERDIRIDSFSGNFDRELMDSLNEIIESGDFEIYVSKTFSLQDAANAQEELASHHLGRIAVKVDGGGSALVM